MSQSEETKRPSGGPEAQRPAKEPYHKAIAAYERSLRLALTGHRSIAGPLLTKTEQPRLLDPFIGLVQYRLGRLYARKGEVPQAINIWDSICEFVTTRRLRRAGEASARVF